MDWIEVALLILGAGAFAVSFLISGKSQDSKEARQIDEDIIKDIIDRELSDAKERVTEVIDETLEYAVEKTERSSERISNEKIMAINEYSETVLSDINKAHQEVMFLYDMLNDKQIEINQTAKLVNKTVKNSSDKIQQLEQQTPLLGEQKDESKQEDLKLESLNFRSLDQGKYILEPDQNEISKGQFIDNDELEKNNVKNGNQNEQILILHRQGKTKVEIAKQLGLGVGEVKRVIDLFQGI